MKRYQSLLFGVFTLGLGAACQDPGARVSHTDQQIAPWMVANNNHLAKVRFLDEDHQPSGDGWLRLCNGKDLTGWNRRIADRPVSYKVEDGVLKNIPQEGTRGNDIYTDAKFEDFEIYYEYRILEGSNSGVYLRGRYEIQVLDDYGTPPSTSSNGAIFGQCAPSSNASAQFGEWQSVRAKIVGRQVTVILNKVKVIDAFILPGPTGGAMDEEEHLPGPILLQGDHGPVEYRNLYLRPIVSRDGN
ncbi:MAG: DUF1080 domain-containing protein [Phycisphaerales bacterium]|nr:DUF1080 domain-containing protein [Phycisphaerales bacterium]